MSALISHKEKFGVAQNVMVHASAVRKSFGHLEVLKGVDLQVPEGSVGVGQEHLPAVHQPPGGDQRRPSIGGR